MIEPNPARQPDGLRTGIPALDAAGLRWAAGRLHVIIGPATSGKTALLMESAMRHLGTAEPNRVLYVVGDGDAEAFCLRLFHREVGLVERRTYGRKADPEVPSRNREIASGRLQRIVIDGRLTIREAPPAHARFRYPSTLAGGDEEHLPAPSLVLIDGFSIARTPLDATLEAVARSCDPEPLPPILVSLNAPWLSPESAPQLGVQAASPHLKRLFADAAMVIRLRCPRPGRDTIAADVVRPPARPSIRVKLRLSRGGGIR